MKEPKGAVNEHVFRRPMPDGSIQEVVQFEVETDKPTGHGRVDLMNDRGKVVKTEEADNFISRLWAITSRSWQRLAWSTFPIQEGAIGYDWWSSGSGGRVPFRFPNHWLAAWNDTSTDAGSAPANEHAVKTDLQGLVAYASRNVVGSPAGKRGQVNVTNSDWQENAEVMIFDWPTTAGNGTFQSIGWCDVVNNVPVGDEGMPGLRASMIKRDYYSYAGDFNALTTLTNYTYGAWNLNSAGDLICFGRSSSSGACLRIAAASIGTGFTRDGFGAAEKTVTPSVEFQGVTGYGSTGTPNFIGEQGGFYWVLIGTTPNLLKINKTTGAVVSTTALGFGTITQCFGVIIGSDAWVLPSGGSLSNTAIHRYSLSSGTPSLTASVTVGYPSPGYVTNPVSVMAGLATDGTDLYLSLSGGAIMQINQSGTLLRQWGALATTYAHESGSTPYIGEYGVPGNTSLEGIFIQRNYIAQSGRAYANTLLPMNNANPSLRTINVVNTYPGATGQIIWMDGALSGYLGPRRHSSGSSSVMFCNAHVGWNLGSRLLLPSAITKTSSNTMKITYTTNFPTVV